ncbi:hypothetical protein NXF25_021100, partial [Crotalus adamanteus]
MSTGVSGISLVTDSSTYLNQFTSTTCRYLWSPLWSVAQTLISISSSPPSVDTSGGPLVTGLPTCLAETESCAREWLQSSGNCYAYFDHKLTWLID